MRPPYDRSTPFLKRRSVRAAMYVLFWAAITVFFASQNVLYGKYAGRPANWGMAITYSLGDVLPWAALARLVVRFARRSPIEAPNALRRIGVHAATAIGFALASSVIAIGVFLALGVLDRAGVPRARLMGGLVVGKLHTHLLAYAAIAGVAHLIDYHRRWRDRELATSQLETRLAQAQLESLRMQLHPHFLFNTLNAISALMHRDVEAADRMLTRLGDLLRLAMADVTAHEVPLRREVEFVERYLEIQRIRFADRLAVRIDVPPNTLEIAVPPLLLQPLVENAIRHGLAARASGGSITVRAAREGDRLMIEVLDDGRGLPDGGLLHEGVGLANTRARLRHLHGAAQEFTIANADGGGVRVTVRVPFRTIDADPAGARERDRT